jgi:alpha-1,6-mannosyltransferase
VSTISAIAESERPSAARVRTARWPVALAGLLALILIAAAGEIVLDAVVGHTPLVPRQPAFDSWLAGFGQSLGYHIFLPTLLVACAAYGGMIVLARVPGVAISKRWAIGLVALLQLILFAGPVLLASDLFTNVSYAREVILGVNPYVHGPTAISGYTGYPYVSPDWISWASPYGPLFTLITAPAGAVGLVAGIWILKLEALIASAATLGLTWHCARRRGHDPVFALVVVGLNPLYVIYALGGSHNDLIMMAMMMGGVALSLAPVSQRRDVGSGAALVAAALVKATSAVLLPFMIVAKRRVAPIVGMVAALVAGLALAYAFFGNAGINLIAGLNREGHLVSSYSFAAQLAHLFGKAGVYPIDHQILTGGLVVFLLYLLWRTWRGYDWTAASGWGMLAVAVSSTWLMPWYTIWPLPLAVISRDRRLLYATLAIQAMWVVHQTSPLWGPVT